MTALKPILLMLFCTACASGPPDRPVRILDLGVPVDGDVERIPSPVRPGGLAPRTTDAGSMDALARGEALYYEGELGAAAEALEAAFAPLEAHPEWLPAEAARRRVVYQNLLVLYRLRVARGGDGEALADWVALHLTDQDPSVLRVPPMVEAAVSGRRDAVRARAGLLTVEVRDPGDWEVHVDGRRVGAAPLRRVELPAGHHAVEIRGGGDGTLVRHRIIEPGDNRVVIEPDLDRTLILAAGAPAGIRGDAPLPRKIRAAGWLARSVDAEAAPLAPGGAGEELLVVPGGGFVRPLPRSGVRADALASPMRWRPWVALGLGLGAVVAGTAAGALAGLRNQEVRDLNGSPFQDTRPTIRRLEAGAWGALGAAAGLGLGGGAIGLWHLLDHGHPALRDLPPVD